MAFPKMIRGVPNASYVDTIKMNLRGAADGEAPIYNASTKTFEPGAVDSFVHSSLSIYTAAAHSYTGADVATDIEINGGDAGTFTEGLGHNDAGVLVANLTNGGGTITVTPAGIYRVTGMVAKEAGGLNNVSWFLNLEIDDVVSAFISSGKDEQAAGSTAQSLGFTGLVQLAGTEVLRASVTSDTTGTTTVITRSFFFEVEKVANV